MERGGAERLETTELQDGAALEAAGGSAEAINEPEYQPVQPTREIGPAPVHQEQPETATGPQSERSMSEVTQETLRHEVAVDDLGSLEDRILGVMDDR